MKSKKIRKINSGLKARGDWQQICDFSKDFKKVIDKEFDKKSANDYNEWRPRADEDIEKIKDKTAEKASMSKTKLEKKAMGNKNSTKKHKKILNGTLSYTLKKVRQVEEMIYSKIMLKFNRCYFNTKDLSASLKDEKDENYEIILNIPKDSLREKVQKEVTNNN